MKASKGINLGYSLSQMLIVLSLLTVLFASSFPLYATFKNSQRQKGLDEKAKIIYTLSSNQLENLSNDEKELLANQNVVLDIPSDSNGLNENGEFLTVSDYAYIESDSLLSDALVKTNDDIKDGNWIIEYNKSNGEIYSVFYSEVVNVSGNDSDSYINDYDSYQSLRWSTSKRKNEGGLIGYYGGDLMNGNTSVLEPVIAIHNDETLSVNFTCLNINEGLLSFEVEVNDGNSSVIVNPEVKNVGRNYTYELELDSLDNHFGNNELFNTLNPGNDLTLTLNVSSTNDSVHSQTVSDVTNSLFAYKENDVVYVDNIRHLLNIDETSKVNIGDFKVKQLNELDLSDLSFKPLTNNHLIGYEGNIIRNLSINEANASLFNTISGNISDITLVDANFNGENVAGLVNEVNAPLTIDHCAIYLENELNNEFNGNNIGGLVGSVKSDLVVTNSFVSTNMNGSNVAGLIGSVESGLVTLDHVYANNHIQAIEAAGLVGNNNGNITISNSYTNGFVNANKAYGLVDGNINKASVVYSAITYENMMNDVIYSTATSISSGNNIYYLDSIEENGISLNNTKGLTSDELVKAGLNGSFGFNNGNGFEIKNSFTSHPYNYSHHSLSNYPYPSLIDLEQYGDWNTTFESGSIVYYERYKDGSLGFYGANMDCLKEDVTIVEDGYGLVLDEALNHELTLVNQQNNSYKLNETSKYYTAILNDTSVYIYPFNNDYASDNYYQTISIIDINTSMKKQFVYNPHFAKTVKVIDETNEWIMPDRIELRTPRHLMNMANYYDIYREATHNSTYILMKDLDCSLNNQKAINNFIATFDGNYKLIENLSLNNGLFNDNNGVLKNIILTNEIDSHINLTFNNRTIGLLVNTNNGTISNCSISGYSLTSDKSTVAGLAGINNGTIENCEVTLDKMMVQNSTSGSVVAINKGTIKQTTGITIIEGDGDTVAGLVGLNSGKIDTCYVFTGLDNNLNAVTNGGTVTNSFYLNGGLYQYRDQAMIFDAKDDKAIGKDSFELTEGTALTYKQSIEGQYPYKSFVTNEKKETVHYGDWPVLKEIGSLGVFYWEKEADGYHYTTVGTHEKKPYYESTLCNDSDNHVIETYGYGYYVSETTKDTTVTLDGFNVNTLDNNGIDSNASYELSKLVDGYTFYAYRTDINDGLYLTTEDKNGSITLEFNNESYTFSINPFFGNSIGVLNGFDDTSVFDTYAYEPGTSENNYEIRNLMQLQYINWNAQEYSYNSLVTPQNYTHFNYLQYTTGTNTTTQNREVALEKRPLSYFEQTHDINGEGFGNFTPIAGASTTSTNSYNSILYAWFGNSFDGHNYLIKNVSINSKAFTVGLFGVTVGADLQNIIMYSDNDSIIQRNTTEYDQAGAYNLGGFIGVAYDYDTRNSSNKIENCAISGYHIVDNSGNGLTLGEANIGGLIGCANVNLLNCSSVVDIEINATHKVIDHPEQFRTAQFGNFIRVGGVAGALQYKMNNCYSGGSITIGEATLNECAAISSNYKSDLLEVITEDSLVNHNISNNIYIGGLAGSGFTMNYQNFTGNSSIKDGNPEFENCYTYISLPKMEKNIVGISMIGSIADRANQGIEAKINNCYYLTDSIPEIGILPNNTIFIQKPYKDTEAYNNMLNGALTYRSHIGNTVNIETLEGLSYEQFENELVDLLGVAFHKVSEGYSYVGNHSECANHSYPFAAIIRKGEHYMHYGYWPIVEEEIIVDEIVTETVEEETITETIEMNDVEETDEELEIEEDY